METEIKQGLKDSADALTSKSLTIEIDILHPTLLQRVRRQRKLKFVLHPACLGTLIKISKALLSIDVQEEDKGNLLHLSHRLMEAHSGTLAYVVALAIVNRKEEPPKELIEVLKYNLTPDELLHITKRVIQQMDISNFVASISLIKGANVLELSLPKQRS